MNEITKTQTDISLVLVMFIVMALIGVVAGGFVVRDYSRARASAAWPIYEGIVLSHRQNETGLRYVYSVGGRTYEGDRARFFSGILEDKQSIDAGPGETVDVFVNPEDPEGAVLQPGGSGGFFLVLSAFCGALIFFGIGGVVRTLALSGNGAEAVFNENGAALR